MDKSRQANVFYNNELAGNIFEDKQGYTFQYEPEFLKKNIYISISLPPRKEPYISRELFPFFRGLLAEGWYLDIISAAQKVDQRDLFGLLLASAGIDTIGAVTIRKVE